MIVVVLFLKIKRLSNTFFDLCFISQSTIDIVHQQQCCMLCIVYTVCDFLHRKHIKISVTKQFFF